MESIFLASFALAFWVLDELELSIVLAAFTVGVSLAGVF